MFSALEKHMRTILILVTVMAAAACGTVSVPEKPVEAEILAVEALADGSIAVDYDVRTDGRDVVLALVETARPERDLVSTILLEFGPHRRHVFSRADLGDREHDLRLLTVIVRDGDGAVLATRSAL